MCFISKKKCYLCSGLENVDPWLQTPKVSCSNESKVLEKV